MDLATIGGIILAIGCIVVAYTLEGGHLGAIFILPAIILVVGGTFGAAMAGSSIQTAIKLPKLMMIAMLGKSRDPKEIINTVVAVADKARREGLLALESEAKKINDPYLRQGIELVVDGTDPALVKSVLETQINYLSERHKKGIQFFRSLGGFSPTLGVLGTVLGMIHALGNTEDASAMAGSIASAFIATLWGVGAANLVYLPIAEKLKAKHEQEVEVLEMITEGVLSIHAGENPRVIRTKLMAFLSPAERKE
jgi:chemotaxis protein MotA